MRRERRGMTLIELMIALAMSGAAILGSVMLLDQLFDSQKRIATDHRADASAGNGDRLLRRLFLDARSTTDTAERFRGDEHTANFPTLCDTPSGWPESCRVTVAIDSLADSTGIEFERETGERAELRRFAGAATFRYLDLLSQDSSWVRRWEKSITLPAAIALVWNGDTTVLPLGSAR